jgi:hypothetical protein
MIKHQPPTTLAAISISWVHRSRNEYTNMRVEVLRVLRWHPQLSVQNLLVKMG